MNTTPALTDEDFLTLEDLLDDLRSRFDETPQWEFCDGFLAALVCCRRRIATSEWLPVLLDIDEQGSFANEAQRAQFLALWQRREDEVRTALDTEVQSLDDDKAFDPWLVDVRGAIAALPPQEQDGVDADVIPSFGQVWALGFMYFVENWPEEWENPKDKEAAKWHDSALSCIVALTEDDLDEAKFSGLTEDGPPTISAKRMNELGEALWAVYDLREIWHSIGPRVQQVVREPSPGRNEPCTCGSGKKFKKCCGA